MVDIDNTNSVQSMILVKIDVSVGIPCLRLIGLPQVLWLLGKGIPFFINVFLQILVNVLFVSFLLKTSTRLGTRRHPKWRLHFVPNSHLDPIGEQHDV